MKYYIMPVFRCVDPETLIGPYKTYTSMLKRARKVRAKQREEDSLFWLLIVPREKPLVGVFFHAEID